MKPTFQRLAFILLLTSPPIASAGITLDGIGLDLGRGNDSTEVVRIHAKSNWDKKWFTGGAWHLAGYWEASLGGWQGGGEGGKDIWDIGITPVFRIQPNGGQSGLYLEGAVGAHLLSATRINNQRHFGSSLNFGDHVGFGVTFGGKGEYDLGYRFQHLSNAGIKKPNDGIEFHLLRFTYRY